VFAHGALYPHRTVAGNVAYGPRLDGLRGAALATRTREVARALHVDELLDRLPGGLSSGQAQRVALGRALANAPEVLLLDEPLSRLDAPLRNEIRDELRKAHRRFATTTLCVTHDQAEAMALGDRLALLAEGKVLQVGTPREVYDSPASLPVAAFFGTPAPATLRGTTLAGTFVGRMGTPRLALGLAAADGRAVALVLRAEALLPLDPAGDEPDVRGVVRNVEHAGADAFVYLDWGDGTLVARVAPPGPVRGEVLGLRVIPSRALAFDVESGARILVGARV
jgi:ABC-type sugar transport system ATPase subunit